MKPKYYQVVGSGPLTVDYPNGTSVAHRPGDTFRAVPTNRCVVRALRVKRVREMSPREQRALEAHRNLEIGVVKPGLPSSNTPIVILDEPKTKTTKPAKPTSSGK